MSKPIPYLYGLDRSEIYRPAPADTPEPLEADGAGCSEAQPGQATYTLRIAGVPVAITLWDTNDIELTARAESMIEFYQEKGEEKA